MRRTALRALLGATAATVAFAVTAGPVRAVDPPGSAPYSGSGPSASPTPTTPPPPTTVLIDTITPKAPTPSDTLRLTGRIETGDQPVENLTMTLRIGQTLQRFDLHRLERDPQTPPGIAGTPVPVTPDHIAAGASSRFDLKVPLSLAPYLGTDGVHEIAVVIRGDIDGVEQKLGEADTFLPVFRNTLPEPTQIVWAVALAGSPQAQPTGALSDASVLDLLGARGRLSHVLTAASAGGATAPGVTLMVDPDLLRALQQASTGPWKLPGADEVHPASPSAAGFLAALKRIARTDALIALPTADADVVSLADANLTVEASLAMSDAREGVSKILGTPPRTDIASPAEGLVSARSLDFYDARSVTTLLLNEAAMPPQQQLSYTPTSLAHVHTSGGDINALVADQAVNDLVAKAEQAAPTPRMAEQLFLAETAMITAQRPGIQQALLVLPPRDWDPGSRFGRAVIADSSTVPWLSPSTVDEVSAGLDETSARDPLVTTLTDLLNPSVLDPLYDGRGQLRELGGAVLTNGNAITANASHALFAAESAAWRNDETEALTRSDVALHAVQQLLDSVRAAAPRVLTLTSESSPIPVTVINELDTTLRVKVNVQAVTPTRLAAKSYTEIVKVPPRSKQRVDVSVKLASSGTFPVNVWVSTLDGHTLGAPSRFVIRSAAYGNIALFITGGGVALLFVMVLIRGVRRIAGRGRAKAESA